MIAVESILVAVLLRHAEGGGGHVYSVGVRFAENPVFGYRLKKLFW